MMDLGLVNDKELVDLAVAAMKVAEDAKSALEKYKAKSRTGTVGLKTGITSTAAFTGRTAAMWPCRAEGDRHPQHARFAYRPSVRCVRRAGDGDHEDNHTLDKKAAEGPEGHCRQRLHL